MASRIANPFSAYIHKPKPLEPLELIEQFQQALAVGDTEKASALAKILGISLHS